MLTPSWLRRVIILVFLSSVLWFTVLASLIKSHLKETFHFAYILQIKLWLCSSNHKFTALLQLYLFSFFLHMRMTVVFRGQMCGQSVMLSHSAHRNSLAEWPVERREHCDQDMAHSTPPAPTCISHLGLYIIRPVTEKNNISWCWGCWDSCCSFTVITIKNWELKISSDAFGLGLQIKIIFIIDI